MGLWGAHEDAEAKPKFLTDVEKRDCYATTQGWVVPAAGTDDATADKEVLVAIRGLSGGFSPGQTRAGLGQANVTSFNFITTSYSVGTGVTMTVQANFNEVVSVTGTPQLTITNTPGDNITCNYASGSGTNRLTFSVVMGAGAPGQSANDVLSFGTNVLALNSGAILDTNDVAAVITNAAGIGTAGGTLTSAA